MSDLDHRFPRYSRLLRLYPRAYYRQYGQQQLQTTADMLDNADGRGARLAIWAQLAIDVPFAIARQQLSAASGVMKQETPTYIKLNSVIAGALLLPFFAALAANSLDKVINNRSLQDSWLWRTPSLAIWVLRLPEVAFVLAAVSYVLFVVRKREHASWLKRALDLRHVWPVVLSGGLAFGILFVIAFHDSGACLVHSPGYLAAHGHQTWQCFTGNSALNRHVFLI